MKHSKVSEQNVKHPGSQASLGVRFLNLIDGDNYPCVGAKSALARESIETQQFDTLGQRENDGPLLKGLSSFVGMIESDGHDENTVHSYVALFDGPENMTELRFESLLWSQLWRLHKLDVLAGSDSADDVSSDTSSPHFSLSLAGHPFFVIGLHAQASRRARQFNQPALVFNSHRQFEKLREDGRYRKMQEATRSRDIALQGSINPNLADFGQESEARQYSGRQVGENWRCPHDFSRKS